MMHVLLISGVLAMQPAATGAPPTPAPSEQELADLSPWEGVVRAGELLASGLREPAIELYRRADLESTDASVRSVARYNLAHTLHAGAVPSAQTPPEQAPSPEQMIESLRASERAFWACLEIDPGDTEAAKNVERIRRQIKAIRDALEQAKQQQQQQQQQMNEAADRLDELAERQEQEAQQNAAQDPAASQSGEQSQQDQSELSEQAQQQLEQLRDQAQQAGDTEQAQAMQEAIDRLEQARDQQQRAAESLEQGEQQGASEPQQNAAEQLREAAQRLREGAQQSGEQGEEGEQPREGEQGEGENQGEELTAQEPQPVDPTDQRVKDLLDKESIERELRDRRRRALLPRPAPVERDW